MTAEIGLSEPLLLVWLVMWIGVYAVIAFAAAAIGVALFGPREVEAVILPGMATLGIVLAGQLAGRLTMDEAPALLGVAGAVGIGASAIQRLVGDRLDADPARWRLVLPLGGIVAGAVAGAVLGLVTNFEAGRSWVLSVALVGAIAGWLVGRSAAAPIDDASTEPPEQSSRPPGD